MTATIADDTQDDSFAYKSCEFDLDDAQLDDFVSSRKRTGKQVLDNGNVAHIKLYTKDTSIKVTQWNYNCVRSTWMHRIDRTWIKVGDREDIDMSHTLDDEFDPAVIIVHADSYIQPQGWTAQIEIDDTTPVVIATSSTRKSVLEGSVAVRDADKAMWKYIANSAIHSLLRGCKTLALPLFVGACIFSQVALGAGFPIASPDGLYHDTGRNILNTQVASLSLSQDDPFCLWVSYPDVDPTSDVAAWVHTAAVDHVSAGRIAILDHGNLSLVVTTSRTS